MFNSIAFFFSQVASFCTGCGGFSSAAAHQNINSRKELEAGKAGPDCRARERETLEATEAAAQDAIREC